MGFFGGKLPVGLRAGKAAVHMDAAVEAAGQGAGEHVLAAQVLQQRDDVELALGGVDLAAHIDTAFLHQLCIEGVDIELALAVDFKLAGEQAQRQAAGIGRRRCAVA